VAGCDEGQKETRLIATRTQNPYTDARAHQLRARYHALFGSEELPVPVEAIAEDLLGLRVEEAELDGVSGLLLPAQRRIVLNGADVAPRRRFTLAHELGHWICQCLEGRTAPIYCRAEEVGPDPASRALEREANVFAAELLMPEPAVRAAWAGSIGTAAERLGVSEEALHWRLYNLGLVAERPSA
jgi:Zn-dependent peptidase ImmA (M78 family)